MNWQQIRLVWLRELRDQLRDRRTLFVIFLLPLLMYPMLGMLLFRLTAFVQKHDGRVSVVGIDQLSGATGLPPLIEGDRFDRRWFATEEEAGRVRVNAADRESLDELREQLRKNDVDVIVIFPPDFAAQMERMRDELAQPAEMRAVERQRPPPKAIVYSNSNRDTSLVTHAIVSRVLQLWQDKIVEETLARGHVPLEVTQPFVLEPQDVSASEPRQALWSKLLPLVMFVWALTGAFYPAVDLCAGEKERGTLETLLTSPAGRTNIVGGKLLTVMTFSAMSALCNMGTLALTGKMMSSTLQALNLPLDPPSLGAIGWLLVGLLPMCTLFSAASLALAALARSSKEGQYYLMPLLLVSMPLLMLPLMPGIELNLSTSLLPVTGLILVLRAAMDGQLAMAGTYVVPMALVTLACCVMAIRWAVSQFNQEEVLFRDTENFDLRSWLRHTFHHRGEVGGLGSAILCILVIYLMQFLVQNLTQDMIRTNPTFGSLAKLIVITQVACFLLPAIGFALLAARRPLGALKISLPLPKRPGLLLVQVVLAVALAYYIQPLSYALGEYLGRHFPMPEEVKALFNKIGTDADVGLWQVLLLLALLPAICEELAFRGFVLSGLRVRMSAFSAILITAATFGLAHSLSPVQIINATLMGVVLGVLALKCRHISPCIAFHLSYNGLNLLRVAYSDELRVLPHGHPLWSWVFTPGGETGVGFTPMMVIAASVVSLGLLALIWQLGRLESSGASRSSSPDADGMPYVSQSPREESRA